MILKCIKAEQMKLRRSFVWLVFMIMPIIASLLGTVNYMNNLGILTESWYSLWTQDTLFYSNFFFAPMIAVYCAYLWRLENFNHNRNALMTAPVSFIHLVVAQFTTVAVITLLTQFWVFLLYCVCGWYTGLSGFPPAQIVLWMLRGSLGGLTVSALQLLLSCLIRSFAVPIAIAAVSGLFGMLLANQGWGLYCPYTLMMLGMNSNRDDDMLGGSFLPYLLSCCIFTLLFLGLEIWFLKKKDVKA